MKKQFVSPLRQHMTLPGASSSPAISPSASLETGSTASDTFSGVSMNSTYRHHQAGPFMPNTPPVGRGLATEQPVLVKDRQHKPKTLGSFGLLVVGLGGANGTTLLAGVLANRLGIDWHGPRGEPNSPNYYGCITQLDQRGKYGGVGYRNKVKGLADASMAAIGGWVSMPQQIYCYYHAVFAGLRTLLFDKILDHHRIFDLPSQEMHSCSNKFLTMIWYAKSRKK